MRIRDLESKDAELMLEWMHDKDVVRDLNTNFAEKTLDDCLQFIGTQNESSKTVNMAVVSDEDEYMGTVSLKHIDYDKKNAEFAITVRRAAMGHGYAWFGMQAIINKAFSELGLESVYWCVSRNNRRAISFYDKHYFHEALDISDEIRKRYPGESELKWYSVLKGDLLSERDKVADCKVIHINTIPTIDAGELSFFEADKDIPFRIKRIYYISKVPEGTKRGYHAHKNLKQVLFCPYGKILITLESRHEREEIELSDPSIGIIIDRPIWREMLWLQTDSVLCVAASEEYDPDDYIRDHEAFKQYLKSCR